MCILVALHGNSFRQMAALPNIFQQHCQHKQNLSIETIQNKPTKLFRSTTTVQPCKNSTLVAKTLASAAICGIQFAIMFQCNHYFFQLPRPNHQLQCRPNLSGIKMFIKGTAIFCRTLVLQEIACSRVEKLFHLQDCGLGQVRKNEVCVIGRIEETQQFATSCSFKSSFEQPLASTKSCF